MHASSPIRTIFSPKCTGYHHEMAMNQQHRLEDMRALTCPILALTGLAGTHADAIATNMAKHKTLIIILTRPKPNRQLSKCARRRSHAISVSIRRLKLQELA